MMDIKSQENNIVKTLLECNEYLRKKKIIDKDILRLYEFNFRSLYCEINDVPLNESNNIKFDNVNTIVTNFDNPYAYVKKVSDYIESYDKNIVVSLNESLESDTKRIDITTYKKDLKKILKKLNLQNDLLNVDKDILKIKQQLNKDIKVKGFNLNSLINRNKIEKQLNKKIFSVLFDMSNNNVIFTTINDENNVVVFCVYNILNDDLIFDYTPKIYLNELEEYYKNIEYTKPNNYFKNINLCFEKSLKEIYKDIKLIGLKYTDNMYADQAQKSLALDIQRKKELLRNSQF